MSNAVQVAQIIKAGLAGDRQKLLDYAALVASNFDAAGEPGAARIIRRAYGAEPAGNPVALDSPNTRPACNRCNYIATAADAPNCPTTRPRLQAEPVQLQEPKEYMLAALLTSGVSGRPTPREKKLIQASLEALAAQAQDYLVILQQLQQQVETSNLGIVNALSFLPSNGQ